MISPITISHPLPCVILFAHLDQVSAKTLRGTMRRVLVVDDEENLRLVLRVFLKKHGYEVEVASSGEQALELLDSFGPSFILTDVRMSGMSGLQLLGELKARNSQATVIVMSAYASVDPAIEAMKSGAYDYIP